MEKRRMGLSPEERVEVVERYLKHEISLSGAAKKANVSIETIRQWCSLYKNEGPTGLLPIMNYTNYPRELKLAAVHEYLAGFGSLMTVAQKYGLRSKTQLINWLKRYNTHKDFKSESGGSRMSQTRETSQEERLKIVLECLASNKDYGAMAMKYQVSYQNVYNWVKKYEQVGYDGLQDRRGRRKAKQVSRTPEEEMAIEMAKLK
ncbi:transposase [uncultured Enterococcus sp.]|uniref:transposase n=1 Tax=uncultured Enterococcus sp. TaxID=167972 RepID=UPI002AA6B4DB|nr:transposase [uncultured Enterococcus sp.]